MEEKNQTVQTLNGAAEKSEKPAINVEQLQGVLQQAEMRMRQMSEQMAQMNQMLRDKTIDQLFEVLKYSVHFDETFVDKSAKCIETYLSNVAFSEGTAEEKPIETKEE